MAKRRNKKGRMVDGIVLLDKPKGLTSNQALQAVKRLFDANKAGHTGSLDPLATGLLPLCLGEATKVSGFLLEADKRYRTRCLLGVRTDSADADGKVIAERPLQPMTAADIETVLAGFRGDISQMPPMHSALKVNGVPLYKLAHQGLEIERNERTVSIYELKLSKLELPFLELEIHCSKGTYVRTLVDDIGERLGCGAHVVALHRDQVGPFVVTSVATTMYSLDELEALKTESQAALDSVLLGLDTALAQYQAVMLSPDAAFYLRQGQPVFVPKVTAHGLVRLYANEKYFIGVGEVMPDGKIAPKRLMGMVKVG